MCTQARQALARALKAWVENETWAPELMPAVLSAGKSPAAEPPLVTAQVLPSLAFSRKPLAVRLLSPRSVRCHLLPRSLTHNIALPCIAGPT